MDLFSGMKRAGRADKNTIGVRVLALTAEALSFVAEDKVRQQTGKLLCGVAGFFDESSDVNAEKLANIALVLATELVLVTPSLTGLTAFDRLARTLKGRSAEDLAAVALLRQSRHRLARIAGRRFEDVVTGEKRDLAPSPLTPGEGVVFGRFAITGDGSAIAAGIVLPLIPDAEAIVREFIRPGGVRSLPRCLETLFRFMVRRGRDFDLGPSGPPPELPFNPETNPLDALAAECASLNHDPGPPQRAKAREIIGIHALLNALISVSIARDGGAERLADAYRWISATLIEFIAAREAHGSSRLCLDAAAAEVDAAIARGQCQIETKTLFNDLREQARLAVGKKPGETGDLDKLVQRIRALREKTIAQGCTEQEAMAAAAKVVELLDRYGLTLSELDLRKQTCEGIGIETGRRRRGPIDDCMGTIAEFFDCRVWSETTAAGTLRYIFFGMPGDVQAAVYLHDLIAMAFVSETAVFQAGKIYLSTVSGQRRTATNSFQTGLTHGIVKKLETLRRARDAGRAGGGRALVPVKQSIIEQELERLGLTLRRLNATRRTLIADAFKAGRKAGEKFEYRPGIAAE